MKLTEDVKRTTILTHEPTGVTVTFKRIGHAQRTKLMASAAGDMGIVCEELMKQGIGVLTWEGVERSDGNAMPYSVAALDAVVRQEPSFGAWFNDNLLAANGWDLVGGDDESPEVIEEKSAAPSGS